MHGDAKKIVVHNEYRKSEYFVGDIVFLKSKVGINNFVAKICSFVDNSKRQGFKAVWYYSKMDILKLHPDALDSIKMSSLSNEMFLSNHSDVHPLNTIVSHCYGMHGWDEKLHDLKPYDSICWISPIIGHDYFCRHFFDVKTGWVLSIPPSIWFIIFFITGLVTTLVLNAVVSKNESDIGFASLSTQNDLESDKDMDTSKIGVGFNDDSGFDSTLHSIRDKFEIIETPLQEHIVRIITEEGSIYDGQTVGGLFEGFGRMLLNGGGFYVGEWFANKFHGNGEMFSTNGYYKGLFANGLRHSWGRYEVLKANKVLRCGDYYGYSAFNQFYSFEPTNCNDQMLVCESAVGIHDKDVNNHMTQSLNAFLVRW